jgi:hypothetical protein
MGQHFMRLRSEARGPNGVPIQDISDTMGHKTTHVTETVYRKVIVPTIRGGATFMDDVFGDSDLPAELDEPRSRRVTPDSPGP